jgi:ATP-dependent RNA helicase SUPV3L1/SUV3
VQRLDRAQGEVDALLHRIAAIRTWTYISHRSGWLADPGLWQERTRGIEDRLSDALHERLTAQFVDRRATVIARQDPHALLVEVDERDEVLVQGLAAGRLRGFVFEPDPSLRDQAKGLSAANPVCGPSCPTASGPARAPDATRALSCGGVPWPAAAGDSMLAPGRSADLPPGAARAVR